MAMSLTCDTHLPSLSNVFPRYLVVCNSTLEAAMIDAGDSDKLWKTEMVALEARHQQRQQSEEGEAQSSNDSTIKITKLLQTHAHIDHVLGVLLNPSAYIKVLLLSN